MSNVPLGEALHFSPHFQALQAAIGSLTARQQLDTLHLVSVGAGVVIGSWWVAVPAAVLIAFPAAWEALASTSAGPERRRDIAAGLALTVSGPVLGSLWTLAAGAAILAQPSTRAVVKAARDGAAQWQRWRALPPVGVA